MHDVLDPDSFFDVDQADDALADVCKLTEEVQGDNGKRGEVGQNKGQRRGENAHIKAVKEEGDDQECPVTAFTSQIFQTFTSKIPVPVSGYPFFLRKQIQKTIQNKTFLLLFALTVLKMQRILEAFIDIYR